MKPTPPAGYAPQARPTPPPGYVPRIALKSDWPLPDQPEPEFCSMCAAWCYHDDGSEAFCRQRNCEYRKRHRR